MDLIPKQLQQTYNWKFSQNEDTVTITFSLPSAFDPSSITGDLLDDNSAISIALPDDAFLLRGRLHRPVLGLTRSYDSTTSTLTFLLVKPSPDDWPFPIVSGHPDDTTIDPRSAFSLSQARHSLPLLAVSAKAGFVPALVRLGWLCVQSGEIEDGLRLLAIASTTYGDPTATAYVGYLFVFDPATRAAGLEQLRAGVSADHPVAHYLMGCLLSPASGDKLPTKNGRAALAHLERAHELAPSWEALLEIAKLHSAGCSGVARDEARGRRLYEEARALADGAGVEIPPLDARPASDWKIFAGVTALATLAFAGLIVRHFWTRRN
jgi:hypothetical protein